MKTGFLIVLFQRPRNVSIADNNLIFNTVLNVFIIKVSFTHIKATWSWSSLFWDVKGVNAVYHPRKTKTMTALLQPMDQENHCFLQDT